MKRHLLFDSNCSRCSRVTKEVEQVTKGWITARSLHDPMVQQLLDAVCPSWDWRPMVLIQNDGAVQIYSGLGMGLYLISKLGFRKAFKLATILTRSEGALHTKDKLVDTSRRRFLQLSGSFLGFAALAFLDRPGVPRLGLIGHTHEISALALGRREDGEIYEGFLLLPEGAPIPDYVVPPPLCPPELNAIITRFDSVQDLENAVNFRAYMPKRLPGNIHLRDISLLQYPDGQMYEIFVIHEVLNEQSGELIAPLVTRISPNYYTPHPLFYTVGNQPDGIETVMNRVSILPSNGIRVLTAAGFVYHWFVDELLYTFIVEPASSIEFADEIAASFAQG